MGEGSPAARGHNLDRQTTLEVGRLPLPILERRLLRRQQRIDERVVLASGERAVDVVAAFALVVARLEPGLREVDAVAVYDGRDRIEKGERILAGARSQCLGQRRRG